MGFFKIFDYTPEELSLAKQNLPFNSPQVWDLTGLLNLEQLKTDCAELSAKYSSLNKNPKKIKQQFYLSYAIGIIGTPLLAPLAFSLDDGLYALFLPWTYTIYLHSTYKKLAIDLIKFKIALERNWIYSPKKSYAELKVLDHFFPEIFFKGHSGFVEDIYRGKTTYLDKEYHFYCGLFQYTTGSGKRQTTHNKHFFSFYTPKKLSAKFMLKPESFFTKFSKKEIDLESNKFNKTFSFTYNGEKNDKAINIVKTLSPAVQEKLLLMKERKDDFEVLFSGNVITFCFEGILFKNLHTNFKNSLTIDQRDSEYLDNELNKVIEISNEMLQYLD